MGKKLRVTPSKFKSTLTFNEWVEKYRVSSGYIEPTKYFQGNPGTPRITMDTKMEFISDREYSGDHRPNLLGRLLSLISF
jgi:hypothetical protein